jgi:uncharacterized protein
MPRELSAWHDRAMPRSRTVTAALPTEMAARDGLAYSLWLPQGGREPRGGVVILHGAGSCKESHHDFARVLVAAGFGAIAFDQRGHGASEGPMDGRVIEDIVSIAGALRSRLGREHAPVALRGSSMGGCFALLAAGPVGARAVVAICPVSTGGLRRGVLGGTLGFDADVTALDAFLGSRETDQLVAALKIPMLLLHAEGDERVPVSHSRELAARFRSADSQLITVPGGHHRSVQHDEELQAVSVRFLERVMR